jgi:hypothetical protein
MASNGVTSSRVTSSDVMSSMIPKLVMYVVYVYMFGLCICIGVICVYVCMFVQVGRERSTGAGRRATAGVLRT